jgi:zinc/manganese transport system permease protein
MRSGRVMVYDALIGPFIEFSFMRRALVGALALSLSAAPLGVFLILKRLSLTGDAMAHAILPGAAIGYLLAGLSIWAMTAGGLIAGLAVALGAGAASRASSLTEDATLAAFYLISLALGVTIVSLRGSNIDLMRVLFGSVLALDDATLVFVVGTATATLIVLAAILRPLVIECADPGFLRSVAGKGGLVHGVFLGLIVLNLVAGFHAIGTLLAVGVMMLPAAAARLWSDDLRQILLLASGFGALSAYAGLILSYHWSLPAGPAVILVAGSLYLVSLLAGSAGGALANLRRSRHLEA